MVLALLRSCIPIGRKKIRKRSAQRGPQNGPLRRCFLEQLEDRTVPSTVAFAFAVEGDSLSTPYSGTRASDGDKSWVQLLNQLRPGQVDIHDFAQNGATSTSLLSAGQPNQVANLVKQGIVHYSMIEIGGNDEQQFMSQIIAGNYQPFVTTVVSNIEKALQIVQSAGHVQQVLCLIPNIGFTPKVQAQLNHNALFLSRLATAVGQVNQQLMAYAHTHQIVCVDSVGIGRLTQQPYIVLAGTQTSDYWSPDNFHPSGIMQGLSSNATMLAFQIGYGAPTQSLRLTDQEILNAAGDAGTPHIQVATYFNVQPYVILPSIAAPTSTAVTISSSATAPTSVTTPVSGTTCASATASLMTPLPADLDVTVAGSELTMLTGASEAGNPTGSAAFSAAILDRPAAEDGFLLALGL